MRSRLPLLALLALVPALAGCPKKETTTPTPGTSVAPPPAPAAPAAKLRKIQVGDSWEYALSGEMPGPDGKPITIGGTMVMTVEKKTLGEEEVMAMVQTMNMKITVADKTQESKEESTEYFTQDEATGDVTTVADTRGTNNTQRKVKEPVVTHPGTWSESTKLEVKQEYDNGDAKEDNLSVTGQDTITTPAGTFSTWKTTEKQTQTKSAGGDPQVAEGTNWYAPEIGNLVKSTMKAAMPGGATMTLEAILQKTSVKP